jgi:hypothetical protein
VIALVPSAGLVALHVAPAGAALSFSGSFAGNEKLLTRRGRVDFIATALTISYRGTLRRTSSRKASIIYSIYSMPSPAGNRRCVPFVMTTLSFTINGCVISQS